MDLIDKISQEQIDKHLGDRERRFRAGDVVKVHVKIKEGQKERIQVFEGLVIKVHSAGISSSMTVRKVSYGVGVERVFPLYAPVIDHIDFVRRGKVRRAKLYYMRNLRGKASRIPEIRDIKDTRAPKSG